MAGNVSNPDDMGPISDINVTPFVDVVLVLLVIFMVTAPVLVKDAFGIRLPKAASADQKAKESVLGLAVTRQGQILLNGQVITEDALKAEIARALAADPEAQAIISADIESKHGDVVKALDLVKTAGVSRFAIQIERSN
jgi:biopolymer transport protein ExbD